MLFPSFALGIIHNTKRIFLYCRFSAEILYRSQNKALLRLKRLQILQGRDGEVWLNKYFESSLRRAFSGSPDDFFPICNDSSIEALDEVSRERWENILCLLATGGKIGPQISSKVSELIVKAGFVAKDKGNLSITKEGFQFLLTDPVDQLWIMVIQLFQHFEVTNYFVYLI